jgi:hypothetical protein
MSDHDNEAFAELVNMMERVIEDISIIDKQVDKLSKLDVDFDPAWSIAELLKAKAMLLREVIYIKMN